MVSCTLFISLHRPQQPLYSITLPSVCYDESNDQLIFLNRICGLTAARIKSVLELDPLDFTYSVVPDLIFGALEIELGIVNACLPILRPLVRKVFGSDSTFLRGWSKKSEGNSDSSKTHKNSGLSDNGGFERLAENTYPLNNTAHQIYSDGEMSRDNFDSPYSV